MCGIAGWIGDVGEAEETASGLIRSLRHRGPDSQGRRLWPGAGLVHARLSIIDLSPAGAQPIANESGTVWAVFNGEIYNHRSLRADLQKRGRRFRGYADSEVLPHLYEEFGPGFVERLRGMFALALYDERAQVLFLARDRFGIKPLFYAETPSGLVFASEVGALRRVPSVDLTPDPQAAADFAALSYVPAPDTLFKGIRCLPPGATLRAEITGGTVRATPGRHHRFRLAIDHSIGLEDATRNAQDLVQRAVRSQLESDVPLGCLLSGGIDSSLVSAAAQPSMPQGLRTYNVAMPDRAYDETWAAVAVAEHVGSRHKTLSMPGRAGTWEGITSLLAACGQPFADTSMFAVHAISREMRKEVTVALCGDGGDEGFGGYYFHWKVGQIARWLRWPGWALRGGATASTLAARLGLVSPAFPSHLRDYARASDAAIVRSLTSWLEPSQHRRLVRDPGLQPVDRHFAAQWEQDLGPEPDRADRLWALAVEYNIRLGLPNDLLFKTDLASMQFGLEIRVPMLDEDLMDFALSLPRSLNVRGREGKRILRRIAAEVLPGKVATKPKMGFAVPVDTWADDEFRRRMRQVLLGPRSVLPEFYHPEAYRPWIEAFADGTAHPEVPRTGLYYRAIMLLAMQMALAPGTAGEGG